MNFPSIQKILQTTKTTWLRFPFSMSCAFLTTILFIYNLHVNPANETLVAKMFMTFILGFPLFIGVSTYFETYKKTNLKHFGRIGVILFLCAYFLLLPADFDNSNSQHFIEFTIYLFSFSLAITFAPFLHIQKEKSWKRFFGKNNEIQGFWQYLRLLFMRTFFGGIYGLTLFLGLAIAYTSMDFLLGFDIDEKLYFDTWAIITGIGITTFIVSAIPKDFPKLNTNTTYPNGIKIFSQYILLPLALLYMFILYAYVARIFLTNTWPEGTISWLIIAFSGVGILAYILLYPLAKNKEHPWISKISKLFFIAILPQILVLFCAIGIRINDYGITESRYYVVLIGIWILAISLYMLLSKKKNIQYIPITLFLLALFSSFGPWSAFSVSKYSQVARFENILLESYVLENGKINTEKTQNLSKEDNIELSNIARYLVNNHNILALQKLTDVDLSQEIKKIPKYNHAETALKSLNIEYSTSWYYRSNDYINRNFEISNNQTENIYITDNFDLIVPFNTYYSYNLDTFKTFEYQGDTYEFNIEDKKSPTVKLTLVKNNEQLLVFPLENIIKDFRSSIREYGENQNISTKNVAPEKLTYISEDGKSKIIFDSLEFYKENSTFELSNTKGTLYLQLQ